MGRGVVEMLKNAAALEWRDWLYLATACRELLVARVRHATSPVHDIVTRLLKSSRSTNTAGRPATADVRKLAWAIAAASARVPWRSDCLIQAMAADRWLRRRHHFPDFFLGVYKDPSDGLKAHAWLRYGDVIVTGGKCEEFTVLIERIDNSD